MRLIIRVLTIAFCVGLISCDRLKRKRVNVTRTVQNKIESKRKDAIDKLIPEFDSQNSDTKYNKKRFKEFFGFEPTDDITDIYCYNDQIGIDSKFQFSFKCNTTSRSKIIKFLQMSPESKPNNSSSGLWKDFKWWDRNKIETITPYSYNIENRYYRYFWYDEVERIAYYFDFDL